MRKEGLVALVSGLGTAQIVAWGTLYYSIAVLGASMGRDLALSDAELYGAFSASLIVSGLLAPWAGRLIDRRGGRAVMAAGTVMGAAGFGLLALAHSPAVFYAAWMVNGAAMAFGLYDAAFAALAQAAGASYRRALTGLTLYGGLASTVFWPASHYLLGSIGWRGTVAVFAALLIGLCLPLYLALLPGRRESPGSGAIDGGATAPPENGAIRPPADLRRRFILLAAAFATSSLVVSALGVHLINILQFQGFAPAQAVWIAALVGPMQVAGRLAEFAFGARISPLSMGAMSFAALALGLICLIGAGIAPALAFAFACVYGAANGINTIVRGTVPALLFGRAQLGRMLGQIAAPTFAARAVAPLAFAWAAATPLGMRGTLIAWVGLASLALVAYLAATRNAGEHRA